MNAVEFAKATIDELKQVPQDVLCALRVGVLTMMVSGWQDLFRICSGEPPAPNTCSITPHLTPPPQFRDH